MSLCAYTYPRKAALCFLLGSALTEGPQWSCTVGMKADEKMHCINASPHAAVLSKLQCEKAAM